MEPLRRRVDVWTRGRIDAWTRQLPNFFFKDKLCHLSKIVSVLLSAMAERFFVSHMRDFFYANMDFVTDTGTLSMAEIEL